jgi:hypothetical protein
MCTLPLPGGSKATLPGKDAIHFKGIIFLGVTDGMATSSMLYICSSLKKNVLPGRLYCIFAKKQRFGKVQQNFANVS